jgi:hypothetical protein
LEESTGIDSDWPPDSYDLTFLKANQSIPIMLYNFLSWCLGFTSEPVTDKKVKINPSDEKKVVSMAQDLIYAQSRGRKQTHKSLALGMAVQQLTGSVRLLKILHGLGHTASSATVSKHNTALAIATIQDDGDGIKLPRNINPSAFTTIVMDNNDFSEETLSGKGTTHIANGIILQNVEETRVREKVIVSKKTRSIKALENKIVPYASKKGTICLKTEASGISLDTESYSQEQDTVRMADFLYILSRKNASEDIEYLPGWTGFNTQIHQETRSASTIGYLPVIDAPVTDMATVNTLLKHSMSICHRLNLPEIVLVFDEAIYAKAQAIRWNDDELKKRLVIRLGNFHTIMSFCSAIAKIFKDTGLQVCKSDCTSIYSKVSLTHVQCSTSFSMNLLFTCVKHFNE